MKRILTPSAASGMLSKGNLAIKYMNKIFALIIISIIFYGFVFKGTIVKGIIVGQKKIPVPGTAVSNPSYDTGTNCDIDGKFTYFPFNNGDSLVIGFIGYAKHYILNVMTDEKVIDIGEIRLVRERLLAADPRLHPPIPRVKDINPWSKASFNTDDLIVKCPDGSVKYTWEIDEQLQGVVLDYKSIKTCEVEEE
jgi:hypothetical protein